MNQQRIRHGQRPVQLKTKKHDAYGIFNQLFYNARPFFCLIVGTIVMIQSNGPGLTRVCSVILLLCGVAILAKRYNYKERMSQMKGIVR